VPLTPKEQVELDELLRREESGEEAPIEAAQPSAIENRQPVSTLEALGRGAVEGANLGFSQELLPITVPAQRGLIRGVEAVKDLFGAEPTFSEEDIAAITPESESAEIERAKGERPLTFLGGAVAGGLSSGLAGAPKTLGQAVKTGATLGAISGVGSADGDLGQRAIGGVTGSVIGAGFGAAGQLASKIPQLGQAISNWADEFSAKSTEIPVSVVRNLGQKLDRFRSIGRILRSEGITNKPQTLNAVKNQVDGLTGEVGETLGELFNHADRAIDPSAFQTKGQLLEGIKKSIQFPGPREERMLMNELGNLTSKFSDDQPLSPTQAWGMFKQINEAVNRFGRSTLPADESKAGLLIQASDFMKRNVVDNIAKKQPVLGESIDELSNLYSIIVKAKGGLEGALDRSLGRSSGGVGPYESLFRGATQSKPIRGMVLATTEVIEKMIPNLGKFGPVLEEAAKRGGQSLASTHYLLMSSNPDYRQQFNKLQEKEVEIKEGEEINFPRTEEEALEKVQIE